MIEQSIVYISTPISNALGERMILPDGSDGVETSNGFLLPVGILNFLSGAQCSRIDGNPQPV